MLFELLHTKPNCLSVTTYTDDQSLYDAVYSVKQTSEKHLLVDISATYKWLKEMKSQSHGLTKKNN